MCFMINLNFLFDYKSKVIMRYSKIVRCHTFLFSILG